MESSIFKQAAKFLHDRKNAKRWLAVFLCLAVAVTGGTIHMLTSTGEAMTGQDGEKVLICTETESEGHVHDDSCYEKVKGDLICDSEEEDHEHDDDCYEWEEKLTCGMEAGEGGHTHTDACYEIRPAEEPPAAENTEGSDPEETVTAEEGSAADGEAGQTEETGETKETDETDDTSSEETKEPAEEKDNTDQKDAEETDLLEKYVETDHYKITVQYEASAKIPEDAELVAEEITPESDPEHYAHREAGFKEAVEDEEATLDFLFNIGFYVDGEEIEPADKVTVMIQFLDEEGVAVGDPVTMVHFKDDDDPELLETSDVDEENTTAFETESFSDYGGSLNRPAKEEETDLSELKAASSSVSGAAKYLETSAANDWQIVEGGYEGNDKSDYKASADTLRVQKNVIPTDTENEFYAYMSVDVHKDAVPETSENSASVILGEVKDTLNEAVTDVKILYATCGEENAALDEDHTILWTCRTDALAAPDEDGWHLNAAELVYSFTYIPQVSAGLDETGSVRTDNPDAQIPVSADTTLTYEKPSQDDTAEKTEIKERKITSPVIQGLLYGITVQTVDEEGNPVDNDAEETPDAAITLYDADGSALEDKSASDGEIYDLQSGDYLVEVESTDESEDSAQEPMLLSYTNNSSILTAASNGSNNAMATYANDRWGGGDSSNDTTTVGLSFYVRLNSEIGTSEEKADTNKDKFTFSVANRALEIPSQYVKSNNQYYVMAIGRDKPSSAKAETWDAQIRRLSSEVLNIGDNEDIDNTAPQNAQSASGSYQLVTPSNNVSVGSLTQAGGTSSRISTTAFPTDDEVLAQIKNRWSSYGGNIKVTVNNGVSSKEVTVAYEDLSTDNFKIIWYVFKHMSDAESYWHIDGILVPKDKKLTVEKKFPSREIAEAAGEDFYITVEGKYALGSSSGAGVSTKLTLRDEDVVISEDGCTYRWSVKTYCDDNTVTEYNPDASSRSYSWDSASSKYLVNDEAAAGSAITINTTSAGIAGVNPGSTDTPTVVRFENAYKRKVKLIKISDQKEVTPLEGAKFTIETANGDEISGTEPSRANGVFYEGTLSPGEYILTETQAPAGHNMLTASIHITISETDGVSINDSDSPATVDKPEPGDEYLVIRVRNSAGVTLPETGGSGTYPYTFGGLAILAIGLMYGLKLRRREERRYH